MEVTGDAGDVIAPGRGGRFRGRFGCVLGLKSRDVGADARIIPEAPEEVTNPGAGITEQGLVDEVDGRGRALDVQEYRADALQVDAVLRRGKYAGPMQSGW